MPRIARVVVPDLRHHATQRGNNRHDVFFTDDDRRFYLAVLGRTARSHRVAILAFCLMSSHVHHPDDQALLDRIRGATRTGRPMATDSMLSKLETMLNRRLRVMPRGRPRTQAPGHGDTRQGDVDRDRTLAMGAGGTGRALGREV